MGKREERKTQRAKRQESAVEANNTLINHDFDPLTKLMFLYDKLNSMSYTTKAEELALIDKQISIAQTLLPYRYAKWRGANSDKRQTAPQVANYIQNFSMSPIEQVTSSDDFVDLDDE